MNCPKCKKGFVTEQINQILDVDVFDYFTIKSLHDRYYKFCSNVMCNWRSEKLDLVTQDKIRKSKS